MRNMFVGLASGVAIGQWLATREKGRGRIGYKEIQLVGTGSNNKGKKYDYIVVVEELKRDGNLSKIKILDISNCNSASDYNTVEMIVGEYVKTDSVDWQKDQEESQGE